MRRSVSLTLVAVAASLAIAPAVQASDPFLRMLTPDELATAPAQKYAKLAKDEALAELRRRGAIFDEVQADKAPGVVAPIRLTSRLDGVWIHGTEKPEAAVVSPFEILDARLALSLWDFTEILKRHDVVELVHYTMYRPGSPAVAQRRDDHPRVTAARGRTTARHAQLPAVLPQRHEPAPIPSEGQTTSRHPAGLAIDVGFLKKSSGEVLSVVRDFQGKIGAQTCGPGASEPKTPEARELRSIVCEAADERIFTYVLSPNFNAAHHDHLHIEIKGGVPWVIVH